MFITINGQLGSGKSEICKILREEYGFDVFHTGKIQREYARELGISTLELNQLCNKDPSYDHIIDGKLVEIKLTLPIKWPMEKLSERVCLLYQPLYCSAV